MTEKSPPEIFPSGLGLAALGGLICDPNAQSGKPAPQRLKAGQ